MHTHPHLRSLRRTTALLLAGSIAALLAGPSAQAQTTVTYTNGQTDSTNRSTSAPNNPTTLTIASGAATLTGALTGTGAVLKTGAGTLTIDYTAAGAPAGQFSGGTTVSDGTLILKDTFVNVGGSIGHGALAESSVLGSGALVVSNATVSAETWNPFGRLTQIPITLNAGALLTMTDGVSANLGSLTLNGATLASTANPGTRFGSWGLAQDVNVGAGISTISATKVDWSGTRTFTVAGTLNVTGTFAPGTDVPSGFGLTKAGNGLMTMSGTNAYTGATTLSAGTLSVGTIGNGGVSGNLGAATNAAANLVFDGGTLQYTGATAGTNRNFTINAGKTATIDITTNNLTVSGASTATNGALTKTGAGTLTLTGANLHSGNATVSQGTLALSGSGSVASSPTIAVASGATLDVSAVTGGANHDGTRFAVVNGQTLHGTGTVLGAMDVSAGGTIAPGNSIGTLAVAGLSLTSATSVFELELDLGVLDADLLNVTGGISLNGSTLDLSLFNLTPTSVSKTFLFAANDLADAVSGTFGTITGVPMGYTAIVDYAFLGADSLGRIGTGNDLAITVVPEPASAAWGLAMSLFALARRRHVRR